MADNNTNELDALMISELPTQATANETDLFEVAIVDANSASGYASKKESAAAIADAIVGEYQYPLRITGTTAKTIAGAINELKNLVDLLPQFAIEVVNTLPVSDISETTIYLVPASDPEQGNYYEEYIYVNNAWELVGTTAVDLSGYYTSAQVDTLLAAKANTSSLATVATSGAYSDLTGKPTIDTALDTTSTNAVENRAVAGAIEEIESEISSPDTSDNEPYLLRDSASGTADRMVDELVGGTIAWNQLVDSGMTSVTIPNGHIYLSKINSVVSIGTSTETEISINDATQDNIFDLTQMFGATIADYIYSLERATAGAGVAFFRKLFPEDYYACNAGELINVKATAHKTTGFNQFDEVSYYTANNFVKQTDGSWYLANATSLTNSKFWTNKTKYTGQIYVSYKYKYSSSSSSAGLRVRIKYKDGTYEIKYTSATTTYTQMNFISMQNKVIEFMDFDYGSSQNGTYLLDFNVNYNDPNRNSEYEPYKANIYPLDASLELRGLFKLDANNKLYFDGDIYESSGKVTRKYGIVDLGSLTWVYRTDTTKPIFQSYLPEVGKAGSSSIVGNYICAKYISVTSDAVSRDGGNKGIALAAAGDRVYVQDSAYTDASTFKTAMSGVMFVYELATPTTETAASFAGIQVVDGDGTEEYVDSRAVPIPVGHNTTYIHGLNEYRAAVESYLASLDARITALENASGTRSLSVSPVPTKSIVSDSDKTEGKTEEESEDKK